MGIKDVTATLLSVPTLLKLKKAMVPRPMTDKDCVANYVAHNAQAFPNRPAILFEGKSITWAELNAQANRYAHHLASLGVGRGDTVSVLMENRIEYMATVIAINKLGAVAGLINSHLHGRPLVHCISVTESKKCIVGEELAGALEEVKSELPLAEGSDYLYVPDGTDTPTPNWAVDLEAASASAASDNPAQTGEVELGDTSFYIFTSGTTGLPKAAVMSNRRFMATATLAHKAGFKFSEKDRLYVCLPLYHATGLMVGVGAALSSGASIYLRRRFSASNFLKEVRESESTGLIYIGELCRYLINTPAEANDHDNPLVTMMGNGLRPDVWMDFKQRFGVKRVIEFYGSSEGNVAFANLMNKDQTIGMTASRVALVEYDIDDDQIVRNADGRCVEVAPGEPGLLLGHINPNAAFEGYTNKEATEQKIERDVLEPGDAWFNTGDLIREIEAGFTAGYAHYQFVDRVGDTFRWRSENVSTNEVGEIINGHPDIEIANVYGVEVPGADGRAGMAALSLREGAEFDADGFAAYVRKELPAYACPVFVRIKGEIDVTGTMKMTKGDLRKEGFDLDQVDEPLYVMKPGSTSYEPLDQAFFAAIKDAAAGY